MTLNSLNRIPFYRFINKKVVISFHGPLLKLKEADSESNCVWVEPSSSFPVAADTSGRIYDDFLRLLFLHAHRESSALDNDIPGGIGHFRFLLASCLVNIKGSVGLILVKSSVMRISIPLDLSSRPFMPPPCFIRSRRPTTLLTPSLVFSPLRCV